VRSSQAASAGTDARQAAHACRCASTAITLLGVSEPRSYAASGAITIWVPIAVFTTAIAESAAHSVSVPATHQRLSGLLAFSRPCVTTMKSTIDA
jgi:hypothetical protein